MVWGGWFFSSFWDRIGVEWDRKGVFGGEEEGGGVRSGPGAARTILLLHIISARPSKQRLMVRTFLKVYGAWLLFFVSARTNKRHNHLVIDSYPPGAASFNVERINHAHDH
jgi:hypothetical protein